MSVLLDAWQGIEQRKTPCHSERKRNPASWSERSGNRPPRAPNSVDVDEELPSSLPPYWEPNWCRSLPWQAHLFDARLKILTHWAIYLIYHRNTAVYSKICHTTTGFEFFFFAFCIIDKIVVILRMNVGRQISFKFDFFSCWLNLEKKTNKSQFNLKHNFYSIAIGKLSKEIMKIIIYLLGGGLDSLKITITIQPVKDTDKNT